VTPKRVSPFVGVEQLAASMTRRAVQCHVRRLLDQLSAEDAEFVLKALKNKTLPSTALHSALIEACANLNVTVPNPQSLQRHRNGSCNCERS